MIFYMGGVVEHSSTMPDPVTLSSAEATLLRKRGFVLRTLPSVDLRT